MGIYVYFGFRGEGIASGDLHRDIFGTTLYLGCGLCCVALLSLILTFSKLSGLVRIMGGLSFLTGLIFIALDSFFVYRYSKAKEEGKWGKYSQAGRDWVYAIIIISFCISIWKIVSTLVQSRWKTSERKSHEA